MHSIINHADNVVQFLDYTTLSILGGSAVIVGQSLVARLRNKWVENHAPQQAPKTGSEPSEPEPSNQRGSEPEPEPAPTATDDEMEDPWETENQTACKLPQKEAQEMGTHASNRRMLKEATLITQDYHRMRKQKLIEICRAKGISANKKKTKKELAAKLGAVA
jgi:hypothetical protein